MAQEAVMPMLHLYRHILRAARHFPSIKRDKMIIGIKSEFRAKKNLSDPKALAHAREVAERGLSDLESYRDRQQDGAFDLTLKGATS